MNARAQPQILRLRAARPAEEAGRKNYAERCAQDDKSIWMRIVLRCTVGERGVAKRLRTHSGGTNRMQTKKMLVIHWRSIRCRENVRNLLILKNRVRGGVRQMIQQFNLQLSTNHYSLSTVSLSARNGVKPQRNGDRVLKLRDEKLHRAVLRNPLTCIHQKGG
jgi:hypothetical protein